MPARPSVAVLIAAVLGAGACGADDRIEIDVVPRPGTEVSYEVTVETRTLTEVAGRDPIDETTTLELPVRYRYGDASEDATEVPVDVFLDDAVEPISVRLDTLGRIQSVEGAVAADLLGPAEVFPAGVGVPDGPLRPGERWAFTFDTLLPSVPGPVTVRGSGRLDRLHVVDGVDAARLVSTLSFEVATAGEIALSGTAETRVEVDVALATGRLLGARSRTIGRFDLTTTDAGRGSVVVEASTVTERV